MISITQPPLVERSSFLFCISGNDGGGVGIYSSSQSPKTCILQSRFIACKGQHSGSSGGGGMIIADCNSAISCTECLFCECHSARIGGGLCYYYTPLTPPNNAPLCSFLFFSKNSVLTPQYGQDVYFHPLPSDGVFLDCFSTTVSPRIYPSEHENWIPLTNTDLHLAQSIITDGTLSIRNNSENKPLLYLITT